MSVLKFALLSLFTAPCLFAQSTTTTKQFAIPFTADSGTLPVPASGPQEVTQPFVYQFPANFPVDTQACIAALAQGAGICSAVDVAVPVTVTYYPITPSVSPGENAYLSGSVILQGALALLGSYNGRFAYSQTISCPPTGSCSIANSTNPIAQNLRFPLPVTAATFTLGARLSQRGAPTHLLDFGTAHLRGVLTVNVNVPAANKCGKADKSYNVPALSQSDPLWASSCYNGFSGDCVDTLAPGQKTKHETIGDYGCNLTALAALLTTAGYPETPLSLNTFMVDNQDYDSRHNVYIGKTVSSLPDIQGKKYNFVSLNDGNQTTASTPDEIADALDNGPLLAGVESRKQAQGHFIVITGRTCQSDGTYQFSTMNPGHSSPNGVLAGNAVVRGYVHDPADNSALFISGGGAVELLVTDPTGKRVGYDPVSGALLHDIPLPDGTYDRDFVADSDTGEPITEISKFLTLYHLASGRYTLRVIGVSAGTYTLAVAASPVNGVQQNNFTFTGIAAPESSATFVISYSANNDIATTIVALPGDTNGDGLVDCADIAVVKASFGKKTGQDGFAANADLNGDGIVDIRDLAIVSQHLPAGTRCQ